MPLHKNQSLRLSVGSLSGDGNGVGRYEGQVVFVPNAAVGDVLQAKVVKAQKSLAYARIEQVITPGPGRCESDCPIGCRCGGCDFRHLTYSAELKAKHGFVSDALRRIGKLDCEVLPVLPAPQENRYRNKVQVPVAAGAKGELIFGFYQKRSHHIVPCGDCLLQPRQLNHIAASATGLLQQAGVKAWNGKDGLLRHLLLRRSSKTGQVLLCLVLARDALPNETEFAARLRKACPELISLTINLNPTAGNVILGGTTRVIDGPGFVDEEICGVPLRLDTHSFSQVNPGAAQRLFGVVRAYAAPAAGGVLLDLYCGTGVIGLSMARDFKQIVGVEAVAPAIEAARWSAASMGLRNARFVLGDAGQAANQLLCKGLTPDVLVADPPRKGLDASAIKAVLGLAPPRLVMVSCNPATLARDLALLCAGGYDIERVQPVDMFPRTRHVECVCALQKS